MCDTFYMRHADGTTAFFAKNSDRDPNEPQYMLFVSAGSMSTPKTYVEMPRYEVKHDVWLSKPSWMWGAEMGVNRCGVCIGNEATFNKVRVDRTGVLGMDHLRVALELASTAKEALEIIIENTSRFGQGGNGGYENPLYYHNSYLITDPDEGYVLETVGRYYAYKKLETNYNISNKLSLKDDFHGISPELQGKVKDFQRHFINPVVSYFAGAYHREARGRQLMKREQFDLAAAIDVLRDRQTTCVASMRNIGMVAGGLISSQTTASLIYDYRKGMIWYTEGPCPEIQLFKPIRFMWLRGSTGGDGRGESPSLENDGIKRWKYNNLLFRAVVKDYPRKVARLRPLLEEYQDRVFELAEQDIDEAELVRRVESVNAEYVQLALDLVGEGPFSGGWQFKRYWRKQNELLIRKEEDGELRQLYSRYLQEKD